MCSESIRELYERGRHWLGAPNMQYSPALEFSIRYRNNEWTGDVLSEVRPLEELPALCRTLTISTPSIGAAAQRKILLEFDTQRSLAEQTWTPPWQSCDLLLSGQDCRL